MSWDISELKIPARMLYLVGGPGNAERVDVSDLFAKRLSAFGLKVDYVIFDQKASAAWQETTWRGARAYVVGRSRRGGLAGAIVNKMVEVGADIRTFWMALTGSYDVIQIRDKFVIGVLGLLAARLSRAKFVYWLSYPYAECRILDGKENRSRFPILSLLGGRVAGWLLYKVIMPNADHVFVQSNQMLRDVAMEGIPENLMTPVPMAVSEELLECPSVAVEPNTILYLGTLLRVRRLNVLIEALSIVRQFHSNARLIFVGEGDCQEDRTFLEAVAKGLGVSEFVEFTGMIPMDQAHERVARAAVCVSPFFPTPILQSTSPTKLSEYMALGRPVVANTHPEQSLIIAESQAGICVDWSAEAFAKAIISLLNNPDAAEQMGMRGREYVRKYRVYPVIASGVAAIYRTLLGINVV